MRSILPAVEEFVAAGKTVALATVVKTWGSAPRQPGSRMAITGDGEIAGSVSGGCVETDVVERARSVMADGQPALVRYTVSHDDAFSVGLTCGGMLELFVQPLGGEVWSALSAALHEDRLVVMATVIRGAGTGRQLLIAADGMTIGALDEPEHEKAARASAAALVRRFGAERVEVGDSELFVESFPPRPALIVVGAVHAAIALVAMARTLGYHTVVIDPRSAFATRERFPHADELIVDWPEQALAGINLHEASHVAVLTHDFKIDVPALCHAVRSPARYVGVLGSRKTHAQRVRRLEEAGLDADQIARIRAPIGLDLGGRSPEQIALAILAEIVATTHGGSVVR